MIASRTRTAITILAASLLCAGCWPFGSTSPPGMVTRVFSVNAKVAGVEVGHGDHIQKGQHVITDIGGKLDFSVENRVDCFQNISTDVIVAPSSNVLLRNVRGRVTCGGPNGQYDQTVAAGTTLIHLGDPVFTVVRRRDTTTLRVFYGSVIVTTTDLAGHAIVNGSARVSTGLEVMIVDGQRPGLPEPFLVNGLSAFELQAVRSLVANEPHSSPSASSSATSPASSATPVPQTITFNPPAPKYAKPGSTYTFKATASSGLPVTVMIDRASAGICTMRGNTITFRQKGTCYIDANQPGNATYQAAPQAEQSVNVE